MPDNALKALGIGKEHEAVPYGQLLRTLPEEKALLLEFWRSVPGKPHQAACTTRRQRQSMTQGCEVPAGFPAACPQSVAASRAQPPLHAPASVASLGPPFQSPTPTHAHHRHTRTHRKLTHTHAYTHPRTPHTHAGLYSMARQFLALQRHPAALQLRYEDAARDFNSTFSPVLQQFFPGVSLPVIFGIGGVAPQEGRPGRDAQACHLWGCPCLCMVQPATRCMHAGAPRFKVLLNLAQLSLPCLQHARTVLGEAQPCDPSTWTSSQTQDSNHVTAGKHPPGARERLQGLLLAQPEVRRHLCLLTEVLGYEEPRCGTVAARRLRL